MARAPRASVPKTSGQGVSRLAYQKGYKLRNSDAPQVGASVKSSKAPAKNYGKSGYDIADSDINVSFGDTLRQRELPEKPPKPGVKDALVKTSKLKPKTK